MKVTSILLFAALAITPTVGLAGDAEKETQKFGSDPSPLPEGLADVGDGTVAGAAALGGIALIGGAAAGLAGGGGSNPVTGTTSTTSTTGTTP